MSFVRPMDMPPSRMPSSPFLALPVVLGVMRDATWQGEGKRLKYALLVKAFERHGHRMR